VGRFVNQDNAFSTFRRWSQPNGDRQETFAGGMAVDFAPISIVLQREARCAMNPSTLVESLDERRPLQILWEDGDRAFCSTWRVDSEGIRHACLAVVPRAEAPASGTIERLVHEFGLRDCLGSTWAARPLELVRENSRIMLLLEPSAGTPLEQLIGMPMEPGRFLRLATAVCVAIGRLHESGLVHKDIKPANILFDDAMKDVRLTGFGISSRRPRERQSPEPPEQIAGTLAYMSPEQTGRMNRSIDSRSDLYSLGVTLYRMLTGSLPFAATEPMEWVHCLIARMPTSPRERLASAFGLEIPGPLSDIVMKLLSKTAEERYQTAAGLERDLRHCTGQWQASRRIDMFALGQHDGRGRLINPERLYGRQAEIETLLTSFDSTAGIGKTGLVLVSGYTGVGKTSVVNEVHKALVPSRGLFASGKFDQYKRGIPYATLAQSFQRLVRPILGKSEAELDKWRAMVLEALGQSGRIITDFVPDLKLIIGEQPAVSDLPPRDAQLRLQRLFRRFIGVFARQEHPLALFLDDLQWLDEATLDLIEDLLTQEDVGYLLLIGAYRDNEVDAKHPLIRRIETIKRTGAIVQEIRLRPLVTEHVSQLIADALRCDVNSVSGLARLVHEKTDGNPFFVNHFLSALIDEGLITFDQGRSAWSWELDRIHAERHTDNVVELMLDKMGRLPPETQDALRQLACLGNIASISSLSVVMDISVDGLHARFSDALRLELVDCLESSYRFSHDRIHEAAYALIPTEARAEVHLRIGRLLVANTPDERRDETIFEIVNQLNRATRIMTFREEREQLAEFNLVAGKRAKSASAYASALGYLTAGASLLPDGGWASCHHLAFSIELERALCEAASGAVTEAADRLRSLSVRATSIVERAVVACHQVDLYQSIDRSDKAVDVGLEVLRSAGIDWPARPTEVEARREYEEISIRLRGRAIENLIDLPLMTDPASLATLDLMIRVSVPGFFASSQLFAVAVCRAVNLGLEQGHSDASSLAYEFLAMLAGPHFGDYEAGYRYGRLGCALVEREGLNQFQARTYQIFGFIVPWTRHVRTGRDYLVRAFDVANRISDITYAGYACAQLNTNLLLAGDALAETQAEAERGLAFAQKVRFGLIVSWISGQLGLVRTLRGLTKRFGSFDSADFSEKEFERHVSENAALVLPGCWYWIRKLQAGFLAGDHEGALKASERAKPLLAASLSLLETVEFHFYDALNHAALLGTTSGAERRAHVDALFLNQARLDVWAESCPDNFANRALLVGAEISRSEGRELDAERLYEQAISSARDGAFIQNEALANELAGRFYAARGFARIANAYFREARHCYLLWGATAKVQQLDEQFLNLHRERPTSDISVTMVSSVERLDLITVIKVSEAVSGEIVLEKLVDTLMRAAIEHAGAERGVLILPRNDLYQTEAEASMGDDGLEVSLRQVSVSAANLPQAVFQFVLRTKEYVLLRDASLEESPFSSDEYLRSREIRSLLCLPLLKQRRLLGVLYLENNLVPDAFTPARMTVLKLLASVAAISLENTRLYGDLQEREARIRRLVDSNIIGIFIWDIDGSIIDANQAFLRIVGRESADFLAGGCTGES
jgi:predicted ATPase/GAF domain-containing protein